MFQNYLKIALRNLLKHKTYSAINIFGLALGLACCMLIVLFVVDELRYDRFHANADRIYRVALNARINDKDLVSALSPAPMAQTLVTDFPEVESSTVVSHPGDFSVRRGETVFNEKRLFYADAGIFSVFTFPLIRGDTKTALSKPNSIILTEEMAAKYFGDADPMGQRLTLDGRDEYQITGVANNVPENSHLHFDFLASWVTLEDSRSDIWVGNDYYTYIKLREGFRADDLQVKFSAMVRKYAGPQFQAAGISFDEFLSAGGRYGYFLQPLTKIHLYSDLEHEVEPTSSVTYIYVFSAIALFILLIACINFMNLATARSADRAREVGIRKVLGSHRSQLLRLFLSESMLISFLSMALALMLVEMLLPLFNDLSGKRLALHYFDNPFVISGSLFIAFLVGFLAGSYPAFFLSSFQPIVVLKGKLSAGARSSGLRSMLVVFQFGISICLMIATVVVYQQLNFVQNKKLGFNKEHVAVIHNLWQIGSQRSAFKQAILKNSGVVSAASSQSLPGEVTSNTVFNAAGTGNLEPSLLWMIRSDFDLVKTLGIELSYGRDFSADFSTDSSAVILNEAAVKLFGLQNPLGEKLVRYGQTGEHEIIGVLKDFHFESLRQAIRPLVILIEGPGNVLSVRIQPNRIRETMPELEKIWKDFALGQPFVYSFLDDDFDALYRAEQRVGKIVTVFSILAICIASLGLLGLAAFTAERRTKEIGIRQVLGASAAGIVTLLTKDFTRLILVANLIAWPAAYLAMNRWLQDFAYRINLSVWTFVLAGSFALLIALLTVSYQAIKAALANPVESLRYE